jgi:hypothetical protein
MSSVILLAVLACLLATPGLPAAVIAIPRGRTSVITRSAVTFGLGYAASAGCAFALAVAHVFRLATFLALWLVVSAALWVLACWRRSLRDQVSAIVADLSENRLLLLIGAVILAVLLIIHVRYLYVLNGPRYIYYLDGAQIANSHGVPATTLEYGQAWPPTTDKILLDAFTGVVVLLNPATVVGPPVLLLVATAGTSVGLWAAGWELGLRRAAVLLPVLYLGNTLVGDPAIGIAYTDYRAEDFGRAVAFCGLAAGIAAVRERGWRLAVAAGMILAAASGTHLIPVVVVVLALCLAGLAQVGPAQIGPALAGPDADIPRPSRALLRLSWVGAVAGVIGIVVRVLAGGSFGLDGAENPASYHAAHPAFDLTAYLYGGLMIPPYSGQTQWYGAPGRVAEFMLTGSIELPGWRVWLWVVMALLAAAVLLLARQLRQLAVVGLGIVAGTVGLAILFSVSYETYIEQTFGIRRLATYVALGVSLLMVGLAEGLFGVVDRALPRLATVLPALAVLGVAAWLLPTASVSAQSAFDGQQRLALVNWVRTATPCGARFLVNQRTEGTFTELTGRLAVLEGMGPFLRTRRLPYVVQLVLSAKRFFRAPIRHEMFLVRHRISYVVVASEFQELGYQAPIGWPNLRELNRARFLRPVFSTQSIVVYRVLGAPVPAPSPLLRGPYLHCLTSPVRF